MQYMLHCISSVHLFTILYFALIFVHVSTENTALTYTVSSVVTTFAQVSTDVSAEGIDPAHCRLVIHFDAANNFGEQVLQ